MCQLKSGLVFEDRVFVPEYDSHDRMLEELGIEDNYLNASKTFVRVELSPEDNDVFSDIDGWKLKTDQDVLPDWWDEATYKPQVVEAVKEWAKTHIHIGIDGLKIDDGESHYIKDCKDVEICDSSTVTVYNSSTVKAYNSSTVEAYDSSSVTAYDLSTVEAYDSSSVTAYDLSTVKAYDLSTVEAWGSSTVEAWGSSTVTACNLSTVKAYGSSTVEAWGSSTVEAWGSSTVEAYDSSSVTAYDLSTVKAYDLSTVEAYGSSTVEEAKGLSTIIGSQYGWKNKNKLILSENSTFKDCETRTIYQSGNWKLVEVEDGGKING